MIYIDPSQYTVQAAAKALQRQPQQLMEDVATELQLISQYAVVAATTLVTATDTATHGRCCNRAAISQYAVVAAATVVTATATATHGRCCNRGAISQYAVVEATTVVTATATASSCIDVEAGIQKLPPDSNQVCPSATPSVLQLLHGINVLAGRKANNICPCPGTPSALQLLHDINVVASTEANNICPCRDRAVVIKLK